MVSNDQVVGKIDRKDKSADGFEDTEVSVLLLSDGRSVYRRMFSKFALKERHTSDLSEEEEAETSCNRQSIDDGNNEGERFRHNIERTVAENDENCGPKVGLNNQ